MIILQVKGDAKYPVKRFILADLKFLVFKSQVTSQEFSFTI